MTGKKDVSVVVVHAADFLDALRCAIIFTDQHAAPGIRVDINPDEPCMEVSARIVNHVTATTAAVAWCKVVDEERDTSFELSIKQIRDILQVFKNYNKRPLDEEEPTPQIGIHLSADEIRWFDETGLGLSVYLYGCQRAELETPSLLDTIATTAEDVIAEMPVRLTSDQLHKLSRVSKIMGTTPTIMGIEDESGYLHRHFVLCGHFRSIVSDYIEEQRSEDDRQEEELILEDPSVDRVHEWAGQVGDAADAAADVALKRVLRVVTASPAGGIA